MRLNKVSPKNNPEERTFSSVKGKERVPKQDWGGGFLGSSKLSPELIIKRGPPPGFQRDYASDFRKINLWEDLGLY